MAIKLVKCPQCGGKGEYNLTQLGITTPVKCGYCIDGRIPWEYYCRMYRGRKKLNIKTLSSNTDTNFKKMHC